MPILNIMTTPVEGLVGVNPQIIYIDTSDTNAIVTVAGYLNSSVAQGFTYNNKQIALVSTTDQGVQFYEVSVAAVTGIITLIPDVNPGNVLLPVALNHIATFTNVAGQIGDVAATAIHGGNIQAGLSGTAGFLASFPGTLARGSLRLVAANNAGDTVTQITNASQAAARVYTIPDGGQAASNFLLTDNAATQTIATGSLALTLGNLTLAAGNIAATLGTITAGTTLTAGTGITSTTGNITASAGNIVAGSSAPAGGNFQSFPVASGGANDKFVFSAVTTGGNFTTTLSNGTMAQTSVYTIPDVTNAVGRVLAAATATPFTANHSIVASGTGGAVADAGYQMKVVAQAAVAGGAAAQTVNDAFCTAASMVVCTWNDTTNAVSIQKAVAGVGSFVVTSSGDPGASHLNYIITKV